MTFILFHIFRDQINFVKYVLSKHNQSWSKQPKKSAREKVFLLTRNNTQVEVESNDIYFYLNNFSATGKNFKYHVENQTI